MIFGNPEAFPSVAGETVAHYRILNKLGGGVGVLYKAEDTRLSGFVALKFLPEGLVLDAQALERFQRETRAASALDHPHIRTICEIREQEGKPFIAMQSLEGRTLKHRIWIKPFQTDELLDLALRMALSGNGRRQTVRVRQPLASLKGKLRAACAASWLAIVVAFRAGEASQPRGSIWQWS